MQGGYRLGNYNNGRRRKPRITAELQKMGWVVAGSAGYTKKKDGRIISNRLFSYLRPLSAAVIVVTQSVSAAWDAYRRRIHAASKKDSPVCGAAGSVHDHPIDNDHRTGDFICRYLAENHLDATTSMQRLSLAILLCGCVTLPARTPERSQRVMTYNIEYGHQGLDSIIAVIQGERPDIVGLQEVDVHWSARSNFVDQAATLSKATGMNYRFARIYQLPNSDPSKPPREFGVALLSRYPIVAFTNHEITRLSTQDSTPTPAPLPGFLDATVDVNGRNVRVFNVHLDYRADPSVRMKQVSEILEYLPKDTVSTILTGDLNAAPDAPELRPLLDRLHETWPGPEPGLTFSSTKPEKRIDYVLVSGGICSIASRIPKVYASDHFPLVIDLIFGGPCGIRHSVQ